MSLATDAANYLAGQLAAAAPTGSTLFGKTVTYSGSVSTDPCTAYRQAVQRGVTAAVVDALKTRCKASALSSAFGNVSIAQSLVAPAAPPTPSFASSGPVEVPAPEAEGTSPVVLGAIVVAVGVVGFVAYSRMKKKGKRRR